MSKVTNLAIKNDQENVQKVEPKKEVTQFTQKPSIITLDFTLDYKAKFMYDNLLFWADFTADDFGRKFAWPAQKTIGKLTGIAQSHISEYIDPLAKKGYVMKTKFKDLSPADQESIRRKIRELNRNSTNKYRVPSNKVCIYVLFAEPELSLDLGQVFPNYLEFLKAKGAEDKKAMKIELIKIKKQLGKLCEGHLKLIAHYLGISGYVNNKFSYDVIRRLPYEIELEDQNELISRIIAKLEGNVIHLVPDPNKVESKTTENNTPEHILRSGYVITKKEGYIRYKGYVTEDQKERIPQGVYVGSRKDECILQEGYERIPQEGYEHIPQDVYKRELFKENYLKDILTNFNNNYNKGTFNKNAEIDWEKIPNQKQAYELMKLVLKKVKTKLSLPSYETWLKPIKGIGLVNNTMLILVPNEFSIEWLESRYVELLKGALLEITGSNEWELIFAIKDQLPKIISPREEKCPLDAEVVSKVIVEVSEEDQLIDLQEEQQETKEQVQGSSLPTEIEMTNHEIIENLTDSFLEIQIEGDLKECIIAWFAKSDTWGLNTSAKKYFLCTVAKDGDLVESVISQAFAQFESLQTRYKDEVKELIDAGLISLKNMS